MNYYATRQLIKAITKLSEELRETLQQQISAIRDTSEAQRQAQEATYEKIQARIAELRIPDDEKEQQNSYRSKNFAVQVILAIVTFGAFIAAAIYAEIAAKQRTIMDQTYGEIIKQTQVAQDAAYTACLNAQIARRALLESVDGAIDTHNVARAAIAQANASIRDEAAQVVFPEGSKITTGAEKIPITEMAINNVGRTSALNIRVEAETRIMDEGVEPDFLYSHPAMYYQNTGAFPPGNPLPLTVPYRDKINKEVVLSHPDFERIKSNETYIVTYARMTYFDIFGTPHWTNHCVFYETQRKESRHQKCAAYNTADRSMALTPQEPAQIREEVPKDFPCVNPRDNAR